MRRRSVTFGILVVFVTWNIITYFFLAYNRPADSKVSGVETDLSLRLSELQEKIKEQVNAHETILSQLNSARRQLQGDLLQNNQPAVPQNDKPSSSPKPSVDVQPDPVQKDEVKEPMDEDRQAEQNLNPDLNTVVLPILIIACDRVTVSRNIDQVIKYRPSAERFPIIVSQDCGHVQTARVIQAYGDKLIHIQQPDLSNIKLNKKEEKFKGYYKIARHYKWALQQVFHVMQHSAVVIIEDDLDIAPDFFEYFAATYPILRTDPSLWCVSAWNDNGKEEMVAQNEPEMLYRTDFFPGLGWMLTQDTWFELEDKWPNTFWDDWMRHPDQRKNRSCIRPEIPRTSTFGKVGVSKGQYFEKHLKFIKHNTQFVPFTQRDLSYLRKDIYDVQFIKEVYEAPLMTASQAAAKHIPDANKVRVQYTDRASFKLLSKQLGIMDDLKSGVPRAGYRGVVSLMFHGRRVFLAPPPNWSGYDPSWS